MPVRERIAGIRSDEIGRPVGAYRVELVDPRTGKVKERIEKSNYISPLALNYARWSQAHGFTRGLRYAHLTGATQNWPLGNANYDLPPTMPVEFIAGLSSAIAEDPTSSWGTGRVLAYASRWKFSGLPASGPRGQINEAQSEVTFDGIKVVFDYNEDQGNGAINSLAICRLGRLGANPTLAARLGAHLFTPSAGSLDRLAYQVNYGYVIGINPVAGHIIAFDHGAPYRVSKFDYASLVDATTGEVNLSGLTSADAVSTTDLGGLSTSVNSSSGVTRNYYLARPGYWDNGTHLYLAYADGTAALNVGKWPIAGGSPVWQSIAYDEVHPTTQNYTTSGVVRIGSFLYCTHTAASTGKTTGRNNIIRLDEATGAFSALLPLGKTLDGTTDLIVEGGIATDGTDLYVVTNEGIIRMDTTGAILEYLGDPNAPSIAETSLSPWTATANLQHHYYPQAKRDTGFDMRSFTTNTDRQTGDGSVEHILSVAHIGLDAGGKLFGTIGGTDQSGRIASIDAANVFSRSVLDSTLNKTNTSTMKWTYEITFPSEWRTEIPHVAPPS